MSVVVAKQLVKTYVTGDIEVKAIRGVNFSIEPASFVSFIGPSGSGKTTLLNMIGCLDPPTAGQLQVVGQDIASLNRQDAARFRGEHIGFVFQDFNLIPVLTVFENIEYPLQMVQNWPKEQRKKRVQELLDAVSMGDQGNKYPRQISGGQKQRVAVARALVNRPLLVLADEPTANLDSKSTETLLDIMENLNKEENITFLFSTHDARVVKKARRVITIEDGKVVSDETR
ncbi:MAG: ABC transporter ATP-binding protein [Desulfuromonadales bacterium]|nr:ABC transporter ATP-binding protein [Desulfuromonadales bacterium]